MTENVIVSYRTDPEGGNSESQALVGVACGEDDHEGILHWTAGRARQRQTPLAVSGALFSITQTKSSLIQVCKPSGVITVCETRLSPLWPAQWSGRGIFQHR